MRSCNAVTLFRQRKILIKKEWTKISGHLVEKCFDIKHYVNQGYIKQTQ